MKLKNASNITAEIAEAGYKLYRESYRLPADEKEKTEILAKIGDEKYKLDRSKGLGENDPEMMWLTTMNPDTRKLIRVMPEDVERTAQMFDLLLGDNLAGRKAHIAECGSQFLDLADIS